MQVRGLDGEELQEPVASQDEGTPGVCDAEVRNAGSFPSEGAILSFSAGLKALPTSSCVLLLRGSIVVSCWGSYLESYKVIAKKNYYGAYG